MPGRILLALLTLSAITGLCRADIPASERAALIAFYNATGGDAWTDNSGWKTPPLHTDGFALPGTEEDWKGVTLSDGHVSHLMFYNNHLTGQLPTELGQLAGLVYLSIGNDPIGGAIPAELGNLSALDGLALTLSEFNGPIPAALGNLTQLQSLNLDNNNLTGPIPDSLANLIRLTELSLAGNALSGNLPTWLTGMTQLVHLSLWGNQFTGALPGFLGSMTQLKRLYLSSNPLTGPVPSQWAALIQLEILSLSDVDLTGPVPTVIGSLSSLQSLSLDRCHLTGALPVEWSNLTNLRYLYARENQLSGPLPSWIGGLSYLQSLFLANNLLSGTIPPELAGLSALTGIQLENNDFTGSIPAGLGGLPNLNRLDLSGNQLSGSLPPELGGLSNLEYLDLGDNQIQGFIPSEWGALLKLRELILPRNGLTGTLPPALGNLTELGKLDVSSNAMGGYLPNSLVNLTHLNSTGLDLDYNAFYDDDPDMLAFVDAHSSTDFLATQTLPPAGLGFTCGAPGGLLSWTPMGYAEGNGGYRVYREGDGSFDSVGTATPKSATGLQIDSVVPGVPYRFYVTSYTEPHENNANQVGSFMSDPLDVLCGTFTPAASLLFPRMSFVPGGWTEGYGFVNPGAADAAVRFTAFAADGQPAGQAEPMAWYAGEQGATQIDGVFGLAAATDGWVRAESNQAGLLGFFLTQHFTPAGLVGLDGAEVLSAGVSDGIIPRVAASGTSSTEIFLANPGDAAITVTVSGLDGATEFYAAPAGIPAKGFWKFDAATVMGRAFDGCLHVQSTGPVIGHVTVRDGDASIAAVNLQPFTDASTLLYAAHVVMFPNVYTTKIQLINVNPAPVTATLKFYLADGSAFGTPLQVQLPALQVKSVSDVELGLPPGENTEGWLKVTCPDPLMGCLTFGNPVDNHYMSTLPLQAAGGDDIYFAQVANGNVGGVNFFTGLAVINPNASPVDVTIRVYKPNGDRNGNSVTRTLAPREKYVRLLKSIEGIGSLLDQSSGYIHVTSTGGDVFSFVLFGDDALDFLSAVPAQYRE